MAGKANTIKIASVQASPVFLDRKASVEKACDLIAEAGRKEAKLAVFPEAFIPAYPDWVWVVKPYLSKLLGDLYNSLLENSISVPDEFTAKLCRAAKKAKIFVVIGINERNTEKSKSSIYNTIIYIDDDGKLIGKHRKLVPTNAERLVWASGDGSTLDVYDTKIGRLSGLICWENYMPLARYAMYSGGTQFYAAPTWDQGEAWQSTIKHIAREGGMYVISSCIAMKFDDIPAKYGIKEHYPLKDSKWLAVGNSAIAAPNGSIIAGPLKSEEGIIYADAGLSEITAVKRSLDICGHYDRPDVFKFEVIK